MGGTTFVVCGFHQGRKLKPHHFNTEAQAREHAAHMGRSLDCVVLTTSTTLSRAPVAQEITTTAIPRHDASTSPGVALIPTLDGSASMMGCR